MSNVAIKFEGVGKLYQLGVMGTGTLSHDLNRWWQTRILGKEDPYLKVGQVNDRSTKGTSDYVWALQNITFDINKGDVVGIIGRNGAGKSTLLKLLSRVTTPTVGTIKARGRIASLLEVGTGFHPELTGRENIYMNGSIMGMTRSEITRKLDEIVDFAGVARYLDTPTKRYSSGMTVRLGFAIAAFLEPEILVVDEVLAVGDAEFQKKAIGKMQDVSKGEGRTVLFVSHNMDSMLNLCQKGILLENGTVKYASTIQETVSYYLQGGSRDSKYVANEKSSSKNLFVKEASLLGTENQQIGMYKFDEGIHLSIKLGKQSGFVVDSKCVLGVGFYTQNRVKMCTFEYLISEATEKDGEYTFDLKLPSNIFAPGDYAFDIVLHVPNVQILDAVREICACKIFDNGTDYLKYNGVNNGLVVVKPEWNVG